MLNTFSWYEEALMERYIEHQCPKCGSPAISYYPLCLSFEELMKIDNDCHMCGTKRDISAYGIRSPDSLLEPRMVRIGRKRRIGNGRARLTSQTNPGDDAFK